MSSPFIALVVQFAGNFAPRGWAFCQGQILPIAQNTALFSLLGTTYGGNGQTTFALPDLRGRNMVGTGQGPGLSNMALGQMGGTENATMLVTQMPAHSHGATFAGTGSTMNASTVKATTQQAASGSPLGRAIDSSGNFVPLIYAPVGSATTVPLAGLNVAGTVTNAVTGGSQPFQIVDPYLGISHIICLFGIFPSRN